MDFRLDLLRLRVTRIASLSTAATSYGWERLWRTLRAAFMSSGQQQHLLLLLQLLPAAGCAACVACQKKRQAKFLPTGKKESRAEQRDKCARVCQCISRRCVCVLEVCVRMCGV